MTGNAQPGVQNLAAFENVGRFILCYLAWPKGVGAPAVRHPFCAVALPSFFPSVLARFAYNCTEGGGKEGEGEEGAWTNFRHFTTHKALSHATLVA